MARRDVTHGEYVQRVRSVPQSEVLRKLSSAASRIAQQRVREEKLDPPVVQEFTLAGIARTSLARGNDLRSREVTRRLVIRLCQEYLETSYTPTGEETIGELLRPMMFEQLLVQLSPMHNIARAHALFAHHLPRVEGAPSTDEIGAVLGVPRVADFTRIGFATHVGAMLHAGSLSKSMLVSHNVVPLFSPLHPSEIVPHLQAHYAWSLGEHRQNAKDALDVAPKNQEGLAFNPLQSRPLIDMGDEFICPAPHFLMDKFTGTGLYYTLASELGAKFTNALGHAFEDHVADQLLLLCAASVHREIIYGKNNEKSCDFLLVFDEVVLLVEAKSSRPPESFRKSLTPARELNALTKACDQITKTAKLIREGHKAFEQIPRDRPLKGMVVTLEPHFISGTEAQEDILEGPDGSPLLEVFAHDLEHFCAWQQQNERLGRDLLDAWPDHELGRFRGLQGVAGGTERKNPVIEYHYQRAVDIEVVKNAVYATETT